MGLGACFCVRKDTFAYLVNTIERGKRIRRDFVLFF